LLCHFLVSVKWLFCGTENRYICTHHGSCDNALRMWCHSSPVRRRYESSRRIANRHFLMVLWRSLGFKAWAKKAVVFTVFQNLLYGMSYTFWTIGLSDENGLYSQNG
jgi:hypothetical protein